MKQRFREVYRHMDIELLGNCDQLSEFCTWDELDLNRLKADLLECIEDKLRSSSNMPNYYENNLQEFDHKRSIYESVTQLPSTENTDKSFATNPTCNALSNGICAYYPLCKELIR